MRSECVYSTDIEKQQRHTVIVISWTYDFVICLLIMLHMIVLHYYNLHVVTA